MGPKQVVAILFMLMAAFPARAVDEGAASAGRAVIQRQVEALRKDDAGGAFAFASPSIRDMFGTEENFLSMVKRGYPPIYRHRSFEFGPTRDEGEGFEQAVRIQDADGVDWDAVYTLERQPDGSWKISGCRLVKRPGDAV